MSSSTASSSGLSTLSGTRMSGTSLMSGLDTESLVKQMASGTKSKITKQQQKLDLLSWKQTSYRSVIDKINTFKSTYFDSLKPETNVGSKYLMSAYKATSSNSKVTVSASAGSNASSYSITKISQLAENAQIKSDFTSGIKLDFSSAVPAQAYSLDLNVDGVVKTVNFTAGASASETATNFNAGIASAFTGTDVPNRLKVDSNYNLKYTNASNDISNHSFGLDSTVPAQLAAVGLSAAASSTRANLSDGVSLDFSKAKSGQTYNLKLNLDGLTKNITFTAGSNVAKTAMNFNTAIATAFSGTDIPNRLQVDGNYNLKYTNAAGDNITHSFVLDSSELDNTAAKQEASLAAVGLTDGVSSKVSSSSQLSTVNFSTPLVGGSYSFKINGEEFTFNKNASIKDIMSEVNSNTKANVTLSFDSLGQKFSLKSNDSGAASSVKLEQTSGNLLTSMFGSSAINAGNKLSSISIKAEGLTGKNIIGSTDFTANADGEINVTVNGVTKAISLWTYDNTGTKYDYADAKDSNGAVTTAGAKQVATTLNEQLTLAFGTDAPSFTYNEKTGKISLSGDSLGDTISVSSTGTAKSIALFGKLGFSEDQTNKIENATKISDLMGTSFRAGTITIGGKSINITANTTISNLSVASEGKLSIDKTKGIITVSEQITATDDDSKALIKALFNSSYEKVSSYSGTATNAEISTAVTDVGKNAVLTINGTTITNASNNITIDGTNINIGNLSQNEADAVNDSDKAITISTARDTSKAYDAVVKFISDYNTLITDLNTQTSTKRPTSDGTTSGTKYDPLTDEQKEAMTDKQIEQWEAKAQTGLLYADSNVSEFLSKLRSAMSTRTSDNFSLIDMGITVSSTFSDHGKLVISDEAKLKNAFEKNADKIQELFTDSTKGLAANVTNAIDRTVSTKRGAYGSMTMLAGVTNTASSADNSITKQLDAYKTTITTLKTRYQDEIERYWAKFTALETTMAKYNNQASVFSSATSSS